MILDTLDNAKQYDDLHREFPAVFGFLGSLTVLPSEKVHIEGTDVYAIFSSQHGKAESEALLEAHRKYIDIHVCYDGTEYIGWRALQKCASVLRAYDDANDILMLADPPDAWVTLHPRSFAMFFPNDTHAPMVGEGLIRKTVVKVLV